MKQKQKKAVIAFVGYLLHHLDHLCSDVVLMMLLAECGQLQMVLCMVDDSTVMTIDSSNNLDISTRTSNDKNIEDSMKFTDDNNQ
ncbi:hypothetical protein T12_16810 [Trichinella patagoniensis]|uniref:Uncharacterized protein n=1 Tax=Trichinella patagoniensis TaxID=990121 RepID=A0A0V0ZNQ2_9BILA|nr:hypothetical protein T12_16810 [Trichinella patagoniensis]